MSVRLKLSSIVLMFVSLVIPVLLAGCGSSEAVKELTADDRFKHAKALYDDRDYLEAINEFTVITLQNQGSSVAPEAQYYLAECRFDRGEYLLAAFEYQVLRRNYPASPRVGDAQYKLGLCYYNLSPRSSLDQEYTRKAIDEFQSFVEYYPQNQNVPDADAKIKELTIRLAKKQYDTARLYSVMEYYKAALMSYDEVIEKYHDTEYAPLAYEGKIDLLMSRHHYREAKEEIDRFLAKNPNSVLRNRFETQAKTAEREIQLGNNVESGATPVQRPLPEPPQL
ncbi:MAG TPA: outer membrane protein assembly factor BamD [Bacteroidota bacterium]|nr:outer membrane protein assembly factor BamD [Bacteroidota bacterium]